MSVDLGITNCGTPQVKAILDATRREMSFLLNWKDVPLLTADEYYMGARRPITTKDLPRGPWILIGTLPYELDVELMLDDGRILEAYDGMIAARGTGTGGAPAKLAVAAALAIALANSGNGRIIDDGSCWVAQEEISPDDFRKLLQNPSTPSSFDAAVHQFVSRLNMSIVDR